MTFLELHITPLCKFLIKKIKTSPSKCKKSIRIMNAELYLWGSFSYLLTGNRNSWFCRACKWSKISLCCYLACSFSGFLSSNSWCLWLCLSMFEPLIFLKWVSMVKRGYDKEIMFCLFVSLFSNCRTSDFCFAVQLNVFDATCPVSCVFRASCETFLLSIVLGCVIVYLFNLCTFSA